MANQTIPTNSIDQQKKLTYIFYIYFNVDAITSLHFYVFKSMFEGNLYFGPLEAIVSDELWTLK